MSKRFRTVYRVVANPNSTNTNNALPFTVKAFTIDDITHQMKQKGTKHWQNTACDCFSTRENAEKWLVERVYNTFLNVSEVKKMEFCNMVFLNGLLADSIIENTENLSNTKILKLLEKIAKTFDKKLEAIFGDNMKCGRATPVEYSGEKKIENARCPRCGFLLGARDDYQPRYCHQCAQKLKYYSDEEVNQNEF